MLIINPFNKYGWQIGFWSLLYDAIGPSQNKLNHHWLTEFDYAGRKYWQKGIPLTGRPIDCSNKQIKKYDPDCVYIKKWLPQFKWYTNKEIYNYDNVMFDYKKRNEIWYECCKI